MLSRLLRKVKCRLAHYCAGPTVPPKALVAFKLPMVELNEILNSSEPDRPISVSPSQIMRPRDMVLPLPDLLSIGAMAALPSVKSIFEIGTYTGETSLVMARNSDIATKIFTLDLPLNEIQSVEEGGYIPGSCFQGSVFAPKIQQLYGRSESFDFSPYFGKCDLVFIDGDHRFEFVKRDTEKALKMVRPGGRIVWDDYRFIPEHIGCRGVSDYLHSISDRYDVRQIEGTRLATLVVSR